MGNTFCCSSSPCQKQSEISTYIMPDLLDMQHVDALIAYIDELMSKMDSGGQEQINKDISVDYLINSGGNMIEKLLRRLKWHASKKCFLSAMDRETRKVVIDVLNEAQPITYLGMALSIIAYLWERAEQASSNKDECLRLLRYMSVLAKHMKTLDVHLDRPKLNQILLFIVKETLMCARQMESKSFCRYIFAPVDAADLENLKSELLHLYPDLELQALTAILNRLPIVPGPSQGEYPHDAVGVEEAQNKVIQLLDFQDSSRRVVVIYGIGGIGKTTLATAVVNRLDLSGYRHCRVFMDLDSKHNDPKEMQEQILYDAFRENVKLHNYTQGREKLSEAFGKASKPVFLFIDNAIRQTDLEMLLPIQHLSRLPTKSRILVTTRNLSETNIFEHKDGIQVYSHRVDSLSGPESKRVLCHYALGDKNGSFDRAVNIDNLLQICEGIPLVLKIVGSHLRTDGNTVSACNDILKYLKEWQQEGFEGGGEDLSECIVDFVYRRMKEPCKQAFLDIAFFFYDWERSKVVDIVGEIQFRELEGAALVTTSSEDKVKMHDIVRARARKLSKGNRVTDKESLCILLDDPQKLQQIKGIRLHNDCEELSLEAKHVDLMSRSLRVLSLGNNTRLNGRCQKAFEDLRVLDIFYGDMLPMDISKSRQLILFHGHFMKGHRISEAKFPISLPDSLRFLYLDADTSDSPISVDIYGHLIPLIELQLSNITVENFETSIRNFSCLKILKLYDYRLERLPQSFDNISSLKTLIMRNCSNLEILPANFGNLCSLQTLYMRNCSNLESLPQSFGNLCSLQTLRMEYSSKLERVPESLGNLSSLQTLHMDDCSKLERLPESFGNLSSLQILYMRNCSKLERLPKSFGNLSSLQYLSMTDCSMLERLPESFGSLSSLQTLYMRNCSNLERLPESFGNLSSLQTLRLDDCCKLERLPEGFGNLASLRKLHMDDCSKLEKLTDNFGNLSSLQTLDMRNCSELEGLPDSFGNLSSLETLDMRKCSKLRRLPQSFGNLYLQALCMDDRSMLETSIEDLPGLHRLGDLAFLDSPDRDRFGLGWS